MSTRSKPYSSTQVTWGTILGKRLRIPMNNRCYSWEVSELNKFAKDIKKIYEEKKYVEKMGAIINLSYNDTNDIYDGQQRIITIILILFSISLNCDKLNNKILSILTIDTVLDSGLDKLTPEEENLKEELNVTKIPKVYCTNPYDRKALTLVLNQKYKPFTHCIQNISDFNFEDTIELLDEYEDVSFQCMCGTTINRKSDFKKHVEKTHKGEYSDIKTDSKIYKAFEVIFMYIKSLNYSEQQYIELYRFIVEYIDIQFYDCNDTIYVSRIFEWENYRGKVVEVIDVIKNLILVKIIDDKKYEVYDEWERLKSMEHPIYKHYGQKLFDTAIQIYNKDINRVIMQEITYKPIINAEDTYKEMKKLFKIIRDLDKIIKEIETDDFGKLIMKYTSAGSITWEGFGWGLLPIFYVTGKTDKNLVRIFVNFRIRNMGFKNRTFNNMEYSEKFIGICKEVFKNPQYDYYTNFKEILNNNIHNSVNNENYVDSICVTPFNATNAKQILSFIEILKNHENHNLPNEPTLEHIYPQKNEGNLTYKCNINLLGNLTLLEGTNSKRTGQRGNSSIKDAELKIKKEKSYKESSYKITREIVKDFPADTFTEADIKARTRVLATFLNENTRY
jgi:hypothetical protein